MNEIKSNLLSAMSMTQSWLTIEDLQIVLPPEQYQELRSDLEKKYAKLYRLDFTQEEIEKEIAEEVADTVFKISLDDKGGFILQDLALPRYRLTRPINPSQLDVTKLASVVEKAMQKHLDYGKFHTNKYLKAEEIPQILEGYINVAKEYQSRDIEAPEDVERATDGTVEGQDEQKAKISFWIEKGKSFIYPERMEAWKNFVKDRAEKLYYGMDLDAALELMEKLESGAPMKEVKKMFDEQGHYGASDGVVRDLVFRFSKRGPEFWKSTAQGRISLRNRIILIQKKLENAKLARLHKDDSTKEDPTNREKEEEELIEGFAQKQQLEGAISSMQKEMDKLKESRDRQNKQLVAKKEEGHEL